MELAEFRARRRCRRTATDDGRAVEVAFAALGLRRYRDFCGWAADRRGRLGKSRECGGGVVVGLVGARKELVERYRTAAVLDDSRVKSAQPPRFGVILAEDCVTAAATALPGS